ncbi:MAG TPA: hypothetical protein VFS27_00650 [Blastocatellia bacterium]|jgi:hypothetical protein|nr:hypothetical protein [Blastocatellia bacterium]
MPKKRGPKPKIAIDDVIRKIKELPMSAKLYDVADALEVEERTVERVIAPYVKILREYLKELEEFDPSCKGFELLHAIFKGKGKRKPRIPSSQYKKLLPD